MSRKNVERRYIRAVIGRIHPDLYEGHSREQQINTESLKVLHGLIENLAGGDSLTPVELRFFHRVEGNEQGGFKEVNLLLRDSLLPLYEAFQVVSQEEAAEIRKNERSNRSIHDVNFLEWLDATIQEASVTAAELATRKELLSELFSTVKTEFNLARVTCAPCRDGVQSVSDVLEQMEALNTVKAVLDENAAIARRFEGLPLKVHSAKNAPVKDYHWVDPTTGEDQHFSTRKWAAVGPSGEVEVVAHSHGLLERLESVDVNDARKLAALSDFWRQRRETLSRSAAQALGVKFVWPDEGCQEVEFCLWAGRVVKDRHIRDTLPEAAFSFNILVHSDPKAPAASFLASCATVQVHHRCSPRQLLEFLLSHSASIADADSTKRIESNAAEEELLAETKSALGARHVVRICSREHAAEVRTALSRLIANAPAIRESINLAGVCIAIDDNYHLWDSGYVSIPYDFDIEAMPKEITKLLAPVSAQGARAPEEERVGGAFRGVEQVWENTPGMGSSKGEWLEGQIGDLGLDADILAGAAVHAGGGKPPAGAPTAPVSVPAASLPGRPLMPGPPPSAGGLLFGNERVDGEGVGSNKPQALEGRLLPGASSPGLPEFSGLQFAPRFPMNVSLINILKGYKTREARRAAGAMAEEDVDASPSAREEGTSGEDGGDKAGDFRMHVRELADAVAAAKQQPPLGSQDPRAVEFNLEDSASGERDLESELDEDDLPPEPGSPGARWGTSESDDDDWSMPEPRHSHTSASQCMHADSSVSRSRIAMGCSAPRLSLPAPLTYPRGAPPPSPRGHPFSSTLAESAHRTASAHLAVLRRAPTRQSGSRSSSCAQSGSKRMLRL